MTDDKQLDPTPRRRQHRQQRAGLPDWLTAVVVLVLLGSFVFNLVQYGPEGYPSAVIIGGLIGAYAGLDQLLKRKRDEGGGGE